jgi:ketosteroid isomerase-like protein
MDLEQVRQEYHRALGEFVRGNPEPQKQLFSRRADVTLANPLGLPVRGWDQVARALEQAAAQIRDGEPTQFELVSEYVTPDLACTIEVERGRMKLGGSPDLVRATLRVTTVFRREEDGWRIAHRHADPIAGPRPIESTVATAS